MACHFVRHLVRVLLLPHTTRHVVAYHVPGITYLFIALSLVSVYQVLLYFNMRYSHLSCCDGMMLWFYVLILTGEGCKGSGDRGPGHRKVPVWRRHTSPARRGEEVYWRERWRERWAENVHAERAREGQGEEEQGGHAGKSVEEQRCPLKSCGFVSPSKAIDWLLPPRHETINRLICRFTCLNTVHTYHLWLIHGSNASFSFFRSGWSRVLYVFNGCFDRRTIRWNSDKFRGTFHQRTQVEDVILVNMPTLS